MTSLTLVFVLLPIPSTVTIQGRCKATRRGVDIKASCKLKNPGHGWILLLLLILHSQQGQRKPEASWEVQCLPSFLGTCWKNGAAGRTQIRSYLHSSSLSCPGLCWLRQARGQQPAAVDGGKDTGVRGLCPIRVSPARKGHMPVKVQCPSYHFLTAFLGPRLLVLHISFTPCDNSMK